MGMFGVVSAPAAATAAAMAKVLLCYCKDTVYLQGQCAKNGRLTSISGGALLVVLLQEACQLTAIQMQPRFEWPADYKHIYAEV